MIKVDHVDLGWGMRQLRVRHRTAQRAGQTVRAFVPRLSLRLLADGRGALASQPLGNTLSKAFAELGVTYVKLGQLLASAPGLVGEEFSATFRPLLDDAPAVPFRRVVATIERELGRPVDEVFAELSVEPIAAASIAVVHRGVLHDGRAVAVKVLRPGVERLIEDDFRLFEPLVDEVAAIAPTNESLLAAGLVAGLRRQLAIEVDFEQEHRAMVDARSVLRDLDEELVVVPEPVDELCTRRVLTMELLDGATIDDLTAIEALGIDPRPVVQALVRMWFASVIRFGTFHGDMHAGNLLVLRDGRIAVLDWGIVGRLDRPAHDAFRNLVAGALGDEGAWEPAAESMLEMVLTPDAQAASGLTAAQVAPFMRERVRGLLTEPFGTVDLARLAERPQVDIDLGPRPQPVDIGRRFVARRLGRHEPGTTDLPESFDRSFFLLGKQLAYFERYGKLYLHDVPLLDDPDRFRALLAAARRPAY